MLISLCSVGGHCSSLNHLPVSCGQVLQEETAIPGSDLHLFYLSSRAAGYKAVLKVTMTQATIPFNLMKVHLLVAVVGRLFQKWFPASPNLSYTYIWDKTDAYNQKVYGLSEAVGESPSRPADLPGGREHRCQLEKPHNYNIFAFIFLIIHWADAYVQSDFQIRDRQEQEVQENVISQVRYRDG